MSLRSLASRARRWCFQAERLDILERPASAVQAEASVPSMAEDCLEHLALTTDRDGWTRDQLIAVFGRRLEEGWHCVTVATERLEHVAWWLDAGTVQAAGTAGRLPLDSRFPISLTPRTAYLCDDYTDPAARGRGYHTHSLHYRAQCAARDPELRAVAVAILHDHAASRRNFERAGFTRVGVLERRQVLGKSTVRERRASGA